MVNQYYHNKALEFISNCGITTTGELFNYLLSLGMTREKALKKVNELMENPLVEVYSDNLSFVGV